MGYVLNYVTMVLYPLLGGALCWWMGRKIGPLPALGVWALAMAAGCAASVMLLESSKTGVITWKNRVAGIFLRWGFPLGPGSLARIAVAAWAVTVAFGALVIFGFHGFARGGAEVATTQPAAAPGQALQISLIVAWVIYGAALLYLMGVMARDFNIASRHTQSILKIAGVVLVLLIASIALKSTGHPWFALIVGGGPIAIIGGIFAIFAIVLMIFGKNIRWN